MSSADTDYEIGYIKYHLVIGPETKKDGYEVEAYGNIDFKNLRTKLPNIYDYDQDDEEQDEEDTSRIDTIEEVWALEVLQPDQDGLVWVYKIVDPTRIYIEAGMLLPTSSTSEYELIQVRTDQLLAEGGRSKQTDADQKAIDDVPILPIKVCDGGLLNKTINLETTGKKRAGPLFNRYSLPIFDPEDICNQ